MLASTIGGANPKFFNLSLIDGFTKSPIDFVTLITSETSFTFWKDFRKCF